LGKTRHMMMKLRRNLLKTLKLEKIILVLDSEKIRNTKRPFELILKLQLFNAIKITTLQHIAS